MRLIISHSHARLQAAAKRCASPCAGTPADGDSALGPRVLLRRLREVMAEPVTAQKRLDKIVQIIAANMVAEVCSIYVMRPGDVLELYATEGLKREAVHKSKLKTGEGLVGTIAEQAIGLNLSDAQHHPAFKYLPETGEEIYNAFLGVPIMRGGTVIGVLVVQNRTRRHYTEEEEEALQTTAMVLAEVIASGELREVASEVAADVAHVRSHHLRGDSLAEGVALGHVVLHEPRVVIQNLIAENVPAGDASGSKMPWHSCAPMSTSCSTARMHSAAPPNIPTCSKPSACSPMTRAG